MSLNRNNSEALSVLFDEMLARMMISFLALSRGSKICQILLLISAGWSLGQKGVNDREEAICRSVRSYRSCRQQQASAAGVKRQASSYTKYYIMYRSEGGPFHTQRHARSYPSIPTCSKHWLWEQTGSNLNVPPSLWILHKKVCEIF